MSRTTARAAAMQMIFEKISGGQGGEDTLKMVYDELREDGLPGVEKIGKKEPDPEDREYISAALEGVLAHREEIDEKIEKTAIDPEGKPMHDAERTKRSMCSMYLQFAENDYSKKQYERFLRYLLSDQYHGVLWHCTAGKDRTGVGAAILQKILGVSDEDIFADYMLTNNYMGTEVEQAKAEFKEEWGYLTEENERALEYLHRTHEDYIRTVLTRIDELFGSFENYITEGLHITKEEEELLKQKYLE